MRIKDGFELRQICGENIIISHGEDNINFTTVINPNATATYIWQKMIGREFTVYDMADAVLEEYEVDRDTAYADCKQLADQWFKIGLIDSLN